MSVLTRLVTDWMGPEGELESIDINFRRPVLQEDALRLLGLIIDAEPAEGGGRVRIDVYFENDRGERPLQGCRRRDAALARGLLVPRLAGARTAWTC